MRKSFSVWLLLALVTAFAILGNLVGEALRPFVPFLGRSVAVGLDPPLVADLSFVDLTFGFSLSLNLLGLVGILVGAYLYRRWT